MVPKKESPAVSLKHLQARVIALEKLVGLLLAAQFQHMDDPNIVRRDNIRSEVRMLVGGTGAVARYGDGDEKLMMLGRDSEEYGCCNALDPEQRQAALDAVNDLFRTAEEYKTTL